MSFVICILPDANGSNHERVFWKVIQYISTYSPHMQYIAVPTPESLKRISSGKKVSLEYKREMKSRMGINNT